jgi:hypothetical protein
MCRVRFQVTLLISCSLDRTMAWLAWSMNLLSVAAAWRLCHFRHTYCWRPHAICNFSTTASACLILCEGIYILTYIQYYSVGLELKPAVHVAAQSVCNSEALQLCCAYLASAIDLHADGAMLCKASFTATSSPQTSCMATSVARTPRKCCCVI